jgi:hypothetical protein
MKQNDQRHAEHMAHLLGIRSMLISMMTADKPVISSAPQQPSDTEIEAAIMKEVLSVQLSSADGRRVGGDQKTRGATK